MELRQNVRLLRKLELLLVTFVAFAPGILSSTFILLTGRLPTDLAAINMSYAVNLVFQLGAIAVLMYVLFRQGRSLGEIGFSPRWRDFPISIVLALVIILVALPLSGYLLSTVYRLVTGHAYNSTQNLARFFLASGTIWYLFLIFLVVNSFTEELIVRAYLISDMEYLTGSKSLAVIVSIGLQTSYHFYQGTLSAGLLAVVFLIFSLYYMRYRRITPVILAHTYLNLYFWMLTRLRF